MKKNKVTEKSLMMELLKAIRKGEISFDEYEDEEDDDEEED